MARQVVETNTVFTGAEAGKFLHRNLTTRQLDALIYHNWPDSKTIEKQLVDPLQAVIQNIKMEQGHKAKKKGHDQSSKKSQVNDGGIEGTKDARRKRLISIGQKLRTSGFAVTAKIKNHSI